MTTNWKDDAHFVGAFVRGGSWEVGLRIARCVTPEKNGERRAVGNPTARVSMREFADEAGIDITTVRKYLATWEWAANDGLVDPAAELAPDDEYDFSGFEEDAWKEYYETACLNPPPWNPQAKPLEPRLGTRRHIAKADTAPTPSQVRDAIRTNDRSARAAYDALQERQAEQADRLREKNRAEGIPPSPPVEPAWKDTPLTNAMEYAVEEVERRDAIRELVALAEQGKAKMQELSSRFGHTGDGEDIDGLHRMNAALTDWQWAATTFIVEPAEEQR